MRFSSETHVVPGIAAIAGPSRAQGAAAERPGGPSRIRARAATAAPRSPRRALVVALALTAAGCEPYVEGNGIYLQEDRSGSVASFVGIHVESGVTASVTAHAATQTVLVSGDANLVRSIRTDVQQDTVQDALRPVLHVWVDASGYSSTNPPTVVVTVPDLVYALAKDASPVDVVAASTPIFTARASGGASVSLVGPHAIDPAGDPAGAMINVIASDATVDAHRYVTTDAGQAAYVDLTGSAHVQLHADGPVAGSAGGSSVVDNLAGAGTCTGVALSGTAKTVCDP